MATGDTLVLADKVWPYWEVRNVEEDTAKELALLKSNPPGYRIYDHWIRQRALSKDQKDEIRPTRPGHRRDDPCGRQGTLSKDQL